MPAPKGWKEMAGYNASFWTRARQFRQIWSFARIGNAPNKQILRATPIRSETAILTDSRGRTNVPEIFAAGECSAIFDPIFAKHRILLYESSSLEIGRLAGRNMAGAEEDYSAVNSFAIEVFNLSMTVWGEAPWCITELCEVVAARTKQG